MEANSSKEGRNWKSDKWEISRWKLQNLKLDRPTVGCRSNFFSPVHKMLQEETRQMKWCYHRAR
jgi:hypothetical protein